MTTAKVLLENQLPRQSHFLASYPTYHQMDHRYQFTAPQFQYLYMRLSTTVASPSVCLLEQRISYGLTVISNKAHD